jgi:hypothetical protein
LFSAYPVLALLAHNLGESRISVGFRALTLSVISAILILMVFYAFTKNWYKAAIHCTFTLFLFFSYGQVYNLIETWNLFGIILGRHRLLLPIYLGVFILGTWWIAKKIQNLSQITEILNIIGSVAIMIPIIQIIIFQINTTRMWGGDLTTLSTEMVNMEVSGTNILPDVYYIVLDAYARGDTMKEFYGFDNDPFLIQLEQLGFYVADCSQSNYAKTRLSLASTLNMDYLEEFDEIAQDLERNKENRIRMGKLIRRNDVRNQFQALGYDIVAFETGYLWSEWDNADVYLSQNGDSIIKNFQLIGKLNDFEALLIKTTAGLLFWDAETIFSSLITSTVTSPRRAHYDYVLFTLDTLESMTLIDGPKFIFAHLISPHGPYVFDANGKFIPDENDTETGYIDQVQYLNSRLIPLLENLIENSETPPIIIIQADHGGHGTQFNQEQRMNILNAYYLPEEGAQNLYESISPVNSFRLIFDLYFGSEMGFLPDVSYYSSVDNFFDFVVVPNQCDDK